MPSTIASFLESRPAALNGIPTIRHFHGCYKCSRHSRDIHRERGAYGAVLEGPCPCDQCIGEGERLRRCGSCVFVYYCSKECQRADWRSHKESCKSANDEDRVLMELFGADMVERNKSFKKWCDRNRIPLNYAAMLALKTRTPTTQIDTHMFVVTVDTSTEGEDVTVGDSSSLSRVSSSHPIESKFSRKVRDAVSMPLDEALDKFLPWYEEDVRDFMKKDAAVNVADTEPGAKFIRILIADDSLPPPMSTLYRPAVIKPEDTADAPPMANDETVWRPFLQYMIGVNDRGSAE